MRQPGSYVGATTCALLILAAVAVWGITLEPSRAGRWAAIALAPPLFWAFLEVAQYRGDPRRADRAWTIRRWHRIVIAAAALLLALPIAIRLAVEAALLDAAWAPVASQLCGILLGIGLAVWGNYLPKLSSPWTVETEPFDWQQVHRFAGLLAFVVGIAVACCWLVLPPDRARSLSGSLLVVFAVITVARKLVSLATHSPGVGGSS